MGWTTSHGPVVYVDLFGEILQLILTSSCTFRWVKVPNHVDIEGNEKANSLAKRGRQMSPLYNTLRHVVRHPVTAPCSPPRV